VTQFLINLYVDFDFEGAQQKLAECETVLENDFFLTALKVLELTDQLEFIFITAHRSDIGMLKS
jgi:translation initiation factor 3 subunit E